MNVIKRFEVAFQASPGPVVLVDPEGSIVLTNQALDTLFEYQSGELVGQKVEVLVPPDVRAHHPDLRDAFFEVPSDRDMGTGRDLFGVSSSGRMIPIEIGLSRLASEDGTWVLASILDITQRKKEEEKLRLAVDAASSAMIMTTQEGMIVLTNSQASETFGYSREEMLNQSVEMLIPQRMQRKHVVYRTSFASNPTRRSMGTGRELFGLRKDGSEFPLEIGLTPFISHDGNYIMATVIDTTERRESQRQIRDKNAELERLNGELTQFAYSASHDLKAPLSTIQGLLAYVEQDLEKGDVAEAQRNVARSRELARRLASLVEGVLDIAKSEHINEDNADVNLREAIQTAVDGFTTSIVEGGIDVRIDLEPQMQLSVPPVRLAQILDNLIGNAVKYTDAEKDIRFVEIVGRRRNGSVELSIADNGIGIPEKSRDDVFKMFRRFENHAAPGAGLGLALVKKAIDSIGGSIEFSSDGQGTRFRLVIPCAGETSG